MANLHVTCKTCRCFTFSASVVQNSLRTRTPLTPSKKLKSLTETKCRHAVSNWNCTDRKNNNKGGNSSNVPLFVPVPPMPEPCPQHVSNNAKEPSPNFPPIQTTLHAPQTVPRPKRYLAHHSPFLRLGPLPSPPLCPLPPPRPFHSMTWPSRPLCFPRWNP